MSRDRLTQKTIEGWCGPAVYADADAAVRRGDVLRANYAHPWVEGVLSRATGELRTRFRLLDNGLVESHCPCRANREHGLICLHVAAVAISVMRRLSDPLREQRYQEEQRRARRMAALADSGIARDPRGRPARFVVMLPADWLRQFEGGRVTLACAFDVEGRMVAPEAVGPRQPLCLSPADDNLLAVVEDIAEGRVTASVPMKNADFLNVLEVCRDRALPVADGTRVDLHAQPMAMHVRMDLDRENGELLIFAHTELPFLREGVFPVYLVEGAKGWAYGAGHLWPLEKVLPLPYHPLYREPVVVPRSAVLRFLHGELETLQRVVTVVSELTPDLFTLDPAPPQFRLLLRGSPASLAAELRARYGETDLAAGAPEAPGEICLPDPDDLLHYLTRNLPAETRALRRLAEMGFTGERGDGLAPVTGTREVLNVLGGQVPALRRLGWQVAFEGRIEPFFEQLDMALPVVHIETAPGAGGHFDVGIDFEAPGGGLLPGPDIHRAMMRGDAYFEHGGRTLLIDRDAVEAMHGVFRDCGGRAGSRAGHFELPPLYAPYVQASLQAIDGIDVEEPPDWRRRAAQQNRELRVEPEALGALEHTLRPYQKEGVYWLRFLERSGFSGILADEMGLGKTLQTLTWLQLPRVDDEARGRPSLIVCPTSLVENWAREAAQFTPSLRCLVMSGGRRHDLWDDVPRHDLVITSYALLRRDLDRYLGIPFAAAVLDEAQHIKNRATQNAVAAKQIRAACRVVLTGTPVENGVADLWSIMDFLMPGYLGEYETFRLGYEQPIAQGEREGERAQAALRRKLHPFLMRRMKRDVARDLPDKIIKTSFSCLTADQQRVYDALLQQFRQRIGNLVAEKGFDRCRMEILTVLMRLRQLCCHLELLPRDMRPGQPAEEPSAKLDQFFEILDEAMDGGHRVLVFSQFVGMLHLLRDALGARGIAHCYLDGQTRERLAEVQRFNLQRNIPVFLISLKAGGTGLNLTGADMVVHFDPWWNPAVEDQATDRAHRIGQKRTVYSIKLITEHTVEEKVLALQRRKQAIIQATVGTRDEAIMQALTWEDVQELLR